MRRLDDLPGLSRGYPGSHLPAVGALHVQLAKPQTLYLMNTLDLARTTMAANPETVTAPGAESHDAPAIQVTSAPEETAPLNLQDQNSQCIPDCFWSDWQNPLNDY